MYKFIRVSQSGDVNCLIKGEFENLSAATARPYRRCSTPATSW
jgi:hypothetical protein